MKITATGISGRQIGTDHDIVFANESSQHTQKTLDISVPSSTKKSYKLLVYNPSSVTALTVKVFDIELAMKGSTRYVYEKTLAVPAVTTTTGTELNAYAFVIENMFAGANLRLVISNDTALGESDGFTATFRLREVN